MACLCRYNRAHTLVYNARAHARLDVSSNIIRDHDQIYYVILHYVEFVARVRFLLILPRRFQAFAAVHITRFHLASSNRRHML